MRLSKGSVFYDVHPSKELSSRSTSIGFLLDVGSYCVTITANIAEVADTFIRIKISPCLAHSVSILLVQTRSKTNLMLALALRSSLSLTLKLSSLERTERISKR